MVIAPKEGKRAHACLRPGFSRRRPFLKNIFQIGKDFGIHQFLQNRKITTSVKSHLGV